MKRLEPLQLHIALLILFSASLLQEMSEVSAVSGLHKLGPVQVTALRACRNQEEGIELGIYNTR